MSPGASVVAADSLAVPATIAPVPVGQVAAHEDRLSRLHVAQIEHGVALLVPGQARVHDAKEDSSAQAALPVEIPAMFGAHPNVGLRDVPYASYRS